MRISPLPPLHFLIAFEAAIRLGSFTRAAAELNVTQSAISRQISQLEAFLGRSLFVREHGTVRATTVGERYARHINSLLTGVSDATSDVMKSTGEQELTIACSSGIALLWLTPRLNDFQRAHPEVRLRMMVKDSLSALAPSEFDVGIYYARHDVPRVFSSTTLFAEEVFPVCSPDYFGGRTVTPAELAKERLLIHEDVQKQWMSWSDWLAAFGEKPLLARGSVTINQYAHLVQLATRGAGVLLAWRHVSDALLEQGMLIRATRESHTFGGAYHLITPNERRQTLAARAFSEWVPTTVGQTGWRIW